MKPEQKAKLLTHLDAETMQHVLDTPDHRTGLWHVLLDMDGPHLMKLGKLTSAAYHHVTGSAPTPPVGQPAKGAEEQS